MKDITSFLIFIAMLNFQTQGQSTFQKYDYGFGTYGHEIFELTSGNL